MKANNATQPVSTGGISRTTRYERSRQVDVAREVRQEQGAQTEVLRKTTIEKTIETTRTRRELESRIRELNKKLDEQGGSQARFQLSDNDESAVQYVDQSGRSFDLQKNVEEFLDTAPDAQSGLVLNTVT
ncbi:MAG: hypothetical protein HY885_03915 [Deltaproteobacteria bacterium]|nr:hypothetical protein [Deltaproteobacteria bacterium]